MDHKIREAWTQQGRPSSLQEVHRRVLASGVSQEPLEMGHMEQVLRRLVFDCRVEEVRKKASVGPGDGGKRGEKAIEEGGR
jgi:hypothetical protein